MNLSWVVGIFSLIFIWNGLLTIYIFRLLMHYNRLTAGTTNSSLKEILEELLSQREMLSKKYQGLLKEVDDIRVDGLLHLQRVGVVRFNPFADTGGNQSFSLAIVDEKKNGIVMTSLYGRNGNRWYVKRVIFGKGETELSKEERSAVAEATPLSELSI